MCPTLTSGFWKDVIEDVGNRTSVTIPDVAFSIQRKSDIRCDVEEIPFQYKYFLHSILLHEQQLSLSRDNVETKVIDYDVTEFRNECGLLEFKQPWYSIDSNYYDGSNCTHSPDILDPYSEKFTFSVDFSYYATEPCAAGFNYRYGWGFLYGQSPEGKTTKGWPDGETAGLITLNIDLLYDIVE